MRPEFPHVVDSTMMAAFKSCHQKFFRTYIEHWKPQGESVHLHAGAAFARGLEAARRAFYEQGNTAEASVAIGAGALLKAYGSFECPEGLAKTPDRMAGALEYYFTQYPLDSDPATPLVLPSGRRAIEFSFAQPLPYDHPTTGDPLIYAGRSDMIASMADGVYIEDDKTASQLGASWARQWNLRSQFSGYCWAAREIRIPVNGVLVRGISILKTKYDTLPAITYRPNWEIDRWLETTVRNLADMERAWKEGYWDYDLDHACTEYGGCPLVEVCKSPAPASWLPVYFERRRWDPLERTETPVSQEPIAA